nr:hypothetical transcript [Hymenolepis microstoma]
MNNYFTSGSNRLLFPNRDKEHASTSPNIDIHSVNPMVQLGLLLSLEGQMEPKPFEFVFAQRRIETLYKIGVGSYSEVYGFESEDVVVKLTPFGGTVPFHNRPQVKIVDMYMEVAATMEISNLRNVHNSSCKTENFVQLKNSVVLIGSLPKYLTDAKRKSNESVPVQYAKEDNFPDDQLWIAFEFSYGGDTISNYWPSCPVARLSIFLQTALALAVGERRLELEHRDLHLGNVLISQKSHSCIYAPPPSYINGVKYQPIGGPPVQIIDFAFARLQRADGSVLYVDMTEKCERLRNESNTVAQMYTMMQELTQNQWSAYNPRTNTHWLGLLAVWYQCSQSNDLDSLPFNEKRSYASKIWQSMSQEQKQVYYDKVRTEQKAYDIKLAEYKKTDEYRQWLIKHENNKASRGKNGKPAKDMNGETDSVDDEFASKFRRIEIFTPEFLDYNKQREMQLRNLRKEVTKQEEETASFSTHIDGLSSANSAMTQQIKSSEESLAQEEKLFTKFYQELAAAFSSLQLPNLESSPRSHGKSFDRITPNNVESFLSKLMELIHSGHNEVLKAKAKECLTAAIQSNSLSLCSI